METQERIADAKAAIEKVSLATFYEQGRLSLMAHAVFLDETLPDLVIACPTGSDAEKDAVVEALKGFASSHPLLLVCFACEAWVAAYPNKEKLEIRPSQREDRREVLVLMFDTCREDSDEMVMLEIERDESRVWLGKTTRDRAAGGRFTGIVRKEGP